MKIKVFGTNKFNTSFIVDDNVLVNLPSTCINSVLKNGYDFNNLDTIIITNDNIYNMTDAPILLVDLDKLLVRHKIDVYLTSNAKKSLIDLLHKTYDTYFDAYIEEYFVFHEVINRTISHVRNLKIEFIYVSDGFGIVVNDKLGLTSESPINDEVKEIIRKSDMALVECSSIEGSSEHMGVDDLYVLSSEFSGVKIIPVYMNEEVKAELIKNTLTNVYVQSSEYTFILS